MKYNCTVCTYSTENSGNWGRHNKSESHIKKVQEENAKLESQKISNTSSPNNNTDNKQFLCPYCSQVFTTYSSLSRHKIHRCTKRVINDVAKDTANAPVVNDDVKNIIDTLKRRVKTLDDEAEVLRTEGEILKMKTEIATRNADAIKREFEFAKTRIAALEKDKEYFKGLAMDAMTLVNTYAETLNLHVTNGSNFPLLEE